MSNFYYPPEGMKGATKASLDRATTSSVSVPVLFSRAPKTTTLPLELPGGGRPNSSFRYAFKQGFSGWDVYAVQVSLNSHQKTFPITEDGIFGPQTHECVIREQTNHHLDKVDGVIGQKTQAKICEAEAKRAELAHRIPVGLELGLAQGESGLYFAAVSGPNWNNSYDAGGIQDNILSSELGSLAAWHRGFDLRHGFEETGKKLRAQYDSYFGKPGCQTIKGTWFTALTYHNWPAAADKMAKGQFDSWQYYAISSTGSGRYYGVDEEAWWVVQASGGRLKTARQWRDDYIASKIIYVKNWTA